MKKKTQNGGESAMDVHVNEISDTSQVGGVELSLGRFRFQVAEVATGEGEEGYKKSDGCVEGERGEGWEARGKRGEGKGGG